MSVTLLSDPIWRKWSFRFIPPRITAGLNGRFLPTLLDLLPDAMDDHPQITRRDAQLAAERVAVSCVVPDDQPAFGGSQLAQIARERPSCLDLFAVASGRWGAVPGVRIEQLLPASFPSLLHQIPGNSKKVAVDSRRRHVDAPGDAPEAAGQRLLRRVLRIGVPLPLEESHQLAPELVIARLRANRIGVQHGE